jgi:uncharacterized protein YyaL (SSP411 family)
VLPLLIVLAAVAPSDQELDNRLCAIVESSYDEKQGGFIAHDGAPNEAAIELAFRIGVERNDNAWTSHALRSIDFILSLQDTLGGGFLTRRPRSDADELGFEKSTIPNARRLELLVDAFRLTNDPKYRDAADRNAEFFDRVLIDGRGGFVQGVHGDRAPIADVNGWAIRAWMRYAALDSNGRGRDFCWKSIDRVYKESWVEPAGFVRHGDFGEIKEGPRLSDQVVMGRALVLAAHMAGREVDLAHARSIADSVLQAYFDPRGGFYTSLTPGHGGTLKGTGRSLLENSRVALFFADLASVTGESRYREYARRIAPTFEKDLRKPDAIEAAEWALALRAMQTADLPERPKWTEAPPQKARPRAKRFK